MGRSSTLESSVPEWFTMGGEVAERSLLLPSLWGTELDEDNLFTKVGGLFTSREGVVDVE
jgi:hypothetical protein